MKRSITAAAAAFAMLCAGAAMAQDQTAPQGGGQDGGRGGGQGGGMRNNPAWTKVREQCAADSQKFCGDKQGRERMQCMRDNTDKLSDGCKSAMAEMQAARQAARQGGGAPQR